ncbi:hypothetical protein OIU79_005444 [Salix purpurea]|uniref:Uncharacterized protein n=1 Tax=Salix purpurea TaxID=77065 RepID=A0A9Q0ZAR0_SALPP|nr:hypothetical protein OIU79_005444 [Salix purpurea]
MQLCTMISIPVYGDINQCPRWGIYAFLAVLNLPNGFLKYTDSGVFGTGMSFPTTARGQLQEEYSSQDEKSYGLHRIIIQF